jgi:hypothetical protein
MRDSIYIGSYRTVATEYDFLDSPNAAHPKPKLFYKRDSALAYLRVTDSLNNESYDTVTIYYNNGYSMLWEPTTYKGPSDTVAIGRYETSSWDFTGYHDFTWKPGIFLDDSTTRYPHCFAPVNMRYELWCTNKIGCPIPLSNEDIFIRNLSVGTTNLQAAEPSVFLQSDKLIVHTGALTLPCRFRLYNLDGKLVTDATLTRPESRLEIPANMPAGLYAFSLRGADGTLVRDKLVEVLSR